MSVIEFCAILSGWATAGFVAASSFAPTSLVAQCLLAGAVGTTTMNVGFELLRRQRRPRVAPPRRGV